MKTGTIILCIILALFIAVSVALYFLGKKVQKQKEEQEVQMASVAQTTSMLIIDKKRMKIKDSGLPQTVIDQIPKYMRRAKLPIVKAKVGPRIMTLIADEAIFDEIPVKKEVKATVSGIYITQIRGMRGALEKPEAKKGFRAKLMDKYNKLNNEVKTEQNKNEKKPKKK